VNGSSIQGRSQDGANIKDFKYLSKGKYFRYLPYLYHLFARGRATSNHGGGGRYNAILEFKRGANTKILMRNKKMRKRKKEKKG
jgi:hypothetical protein